MVSTVFFKKPKSDAQKSAGGYIGYYGLNDWWLSCFSEDERDYIVNTFESLVLGGGGRDYLIEGNIDSSNKSPSHFLYEIASFFYKKEDRNIGFSFLEKAEELLDVNCDILDFHFLYSNKIKLYYKHREIEADALATAIEACKQQIAIAPEAKKAFLNSDLYKDTQLPAHVGFKQLAIIEEKRKNYKKAIEISKTALEARLVRWLGKKNWEMHEKTNKAWVGLIWKLIWPWLFFKLSIVREI